MRRMVAALAALCALASAFVAQAASVTAYVKTNSLKVYASASTSSRSLGTLNFGESITYVRKKGSWAKVMGDNGAVGYCKYSGLQAKNPNGAVKLYYAKTDGIYAYKRTSTSSKAAARYAANAEVRVVAVTKDKKWFRVELDGGYGYVQVSKVTNKKPMDPVTVYIAKNTVQFYKSKSTSSKKIGVMSYGESLTCVKVDGSWAMVKNAAGKAGWCKKNQLTTTDPNTAAETWYSMTSGASVYAQPVTSARKIGKLTEGQEVDVVAETSDGKWMRLDLDGKYGYVASSTLTEREPEAPQPPEAPANPGYDDDNRGSASAAIERVIGIAVDQYGKKYVYATKGPNTYDCSGLTCYAFSNGAGVSLNRSAYAQGYDTRFEKITSAGALKRGDIVCFNTVESDVDLSDHTGIYLGGGKFIHASSGAGKVIVSTLTSGYYSRAFSWGLRVLD